MKKLSYDYVKQIAKNLFINSGDSFKIITDSNKIDEWQNQRRLELDKKGQNPEWAEIGVILDDPYVVVLRDLVEFPDMSQRGYIRLYNRAYLESGAGSVVILPERDGKILIMHNFRHATRSWLWEIPRGYGEVDVSTENQAKIELKEEIGVNISNLVNLGTFYSNTGLEGHPVDLFLARIAIDAVIQPEIGIDAIRWVSVKELESMIADAEITDGFTIAAYTRAKLKGLI